MDALAQETDASLTTPPWTGLGRSLTLGLVSAGSKLLLRVCNRLVVDAPDLARFQFWAMQREPGVGLLTYSNHISTYDDPGLPSAMLPWWMFWGEHQHSKMRWTLCARDVCFLNELLRQFFASGKAMPVDRGAGVHQPVVGAVARLLGAGDWLHLFPEGRVEASGRLGAFRQGIGKVVCDARAAAGGRDPVVLPFFHSGMGRVMPYGSSLPRVGHDVTVVVGEPVDLGHITCRCNCEGEDQAEVWRDIAAALREALGQLEARAPPNPDQLLERPGLVELLKAKARRAAEARRAAVSGVLSGGRGVRSLADASGGDAGSIGNSSSGGGGGAEAVGQWRPEGAVGASAASAVQRVLLAPPAWLPDQERRQRLWAEWQRAQQLRRRRAEEAGAAGAELGQAPGMPLHHHRQQQQQQQQPTSSCAEQDAPRRWRRWLWPASDQGLGTQQPQALLQQQAGDAGMQQQEHEQQQRRWQWAWRRKVHAVGGDAEGGAEQAKGAAAAWVSKTRQAAAGAAAGQQCAAS